MSYDYNQSRASPYPPVNASHSGPGAYNQPVQPSYGQPAQPHGQQQYANHSYGQPPPLQQYNNQYGAPQPSGQYPPPGGQAGYAPQAQQGPPPSQGRTSEAELQAWFQAVDLDRSGFISEIELKQALVNGDWTPFSDETVKMLHRQFGQDGRIDFRGYCGLYTYVAEWKEVFARFDADRSGSIQTPELGNALQSFGFTLNPNLVQLLARKYSSAPPAGQYRGPAQAGVSFDGFIRCAVTVRHLSDSFRRADTDNDGWASLSYDQFLTIMLSAP